MQKNTIVLFCFSFLLITNLHALERQGHIPLLVLDEVEVVLGYGVCDQRPTAGLLPDPVRRGREGHLPQGEAGHDRGRCDDPAGASHSVVRLR